MLTFTATITINSITMKKMKTHLLMYLCCVALLFAACTNDEPKPDDGNPKEETEAKPFVSEKDFNELIVGKYWKSTHEGGRYNAKGESEAIEVVGLNEIEAFYIDGSKFRNYGTSILHEFYNVDIKLYDGKTGILYTVNDEHTPIHFEKIEDGKLRITYDYDKGMPRIDENNKLYWEEGSYIMEIFRPASDAEIAKLNEYDDIT